VTGLHAPGFAEEAVRERARLGAAAAFPDRAGYGRTLFGATGPGATGPGATGLGATGRAHGADLIDALRVVPPVFVPQRLEELIRLGREPVYLDVDLVTPVGGFRSALPVYLSAFGSTQVASTDLGVAVAIAGGRAGVPMVIGENVVPMHGYGRAAPDASAGMLLDRVRAYAEHVPDGLGGVVIQQSTEDADAEVWNLAYSDPTATGLLDSGRLAFELKVGQGAKPGLGGMTVVSRDTAATVAEQYLVDELFGQDAPQVLRCSSPGTFTDEILRQQIRLMRNNYPRARVWVKLPPGRDIGAAALVAWAAGADAVTVDGAEGGTGWAPLGFLDHVGLPLAECLRRVGLAARQADRQRGCLLASGRMWAGHRAVKTLALGATAVGLGRAALIAADEDPGHGVGRLLDCLALELRLLISAVGKYSPAALDGDDIWQPDGLAPDGLRGERIHEYLNH
jgi:isopentenyl diphosphate isomerase/L-lactate dehydrogenase-like FMN-dependent dehydrogenase